MSIKEKLTRIKRIIRVTVIRRIIHLTRKIVLPGFEGVSLWEVLFFFTYSIKRGVLTTRAAAISFHFFLALIPFGLILVILSAQVPFFDIEKDVAPILSNFLPDILIRTFLENAAHFQESSVSSVISFGFVIALYFTSNGFDMLIRTFNSSMFDTDRRKWWSVKLLSLGFVVAYIVGILTLFFMILTARKLLTFAADHSLFVEDHFGGIFSIVSFILVSALIYFGVAILYYFAPKDRNSFRFFSAGATLATIIILIISFAYSYYVTSVAKYSEFYGSLGTIMILVLWIYLNSFALLIGFELNASIHGVLRKKKLANLEEMKKRYEMELR